MTDRQIWDHKSMKKVIEAVQEKKIGIEHFLICRATFRSVKGEKTFSVKISTKIVRRLVENLKFFRDPVFFGMTRNSVQELAVNVQTTSKHTQNTVKRTQSYLSAINMPPQKYWFFGKCVRK